TLKRDGRVKEAERVKALAKPSVTAWAVNQLYWTRREAFERLMASGRRFRQAQASQLAGKGADFRAARDERDQELSRLARVAETLLRDAGHNVTPETSRRIAINLEALSASAERAGGPRPGQLSEDLEPPGFET